MSRHYQRRGNAMIMAVAMTVMLAIIGTSFVIMTRVDRTAVRGSADNHAVDQALEVVVNRIEQVLVDDLVKRDAADRRTFLDGNDLDKPYLSREMYDAITNNDPWLAPIEPATSGQWQQTSVLFPQPNGSLLPSSLNVKAYQPVNPASGYPANAAADADGDGIVDSIFQPLSPGLIDIPDKQVFAAVRIIDNCGMLNVNTAWRMEDVQPTMNRDGFGEFPGQADPVAIMKRIATGGFAQAIDRLMAERLPTDPPNDVSQDPAFLYNRGIDQQRVYYLSLISRLANPRAPEWIDYNADGLVTQNEMVEGWWQYFDPFGVEDELELRNRFFLNGKSIARLEMTLEPFTGLVGGSQGNSFAGYPLSSTAEWYDRLTVPKPNGAAPWSDQRHLLTAYSWDREVRSGDFDKNDAQQRLMRQLGFARSLNIAKVIEDLVAVDDVSIANMANDNITPGCRAIRTLAYAFAMLGGSNDQARQEWMLRGLQYAANLRDYYDADYEVTVIPAGALGQLNGVNFPAQQIYGFDAQPFITEVVSEVQSSVGTKIKWLGLELFNPYNVPIDLTGWTLDVVGTDANEEWSQALDGAVIPAGDRIIITPVTADTSPAEQRKYVPLNYPLESVFPPNDATAMPNLNYFTEISFTNPLKEINLKRPVQPAIYPNLRITADQVINGVAAGQTSVNALEDLTKNDGLNVAQRGPRFDPALATAQKPQVDRFRHGWQFAYNQFGVRKQDATDSFIVLASMGNNDPNGDIGFGSWEKPHGLFRDATQITPGLPLANSIVRVAPGAEPNPLPHYSWPDLAKVTYFLGTQLSGTNVEPDDTAPVTTQLVDPNIVSGTEATIRFDAAGTGARVLDLFSFYSRAADRKDNANEDGDGSPFTFDSLVETRFPGRININTAPPGVLRAIVPPLASEGMTYGSPEHEQLRDDVVAFLVTARPFGSMGDLMSKWRDYTGPSGVDGSLWPNKWLVSDVAAAAPIKPAEMDPAVPELLDSNIGTGTVWWRDPATRALSPYPIDCTMGDFEERDYLFHRIRNLITVRSDTFTAYILVRIQNENGSDPVERRVMGIFDRSNVFLPQTLAEDGYWVNNVTTGATPTAANYERWYPDGTESTPTYDLNKNGRYDRGEPFDDINGNGFFSPDASGEMAIYDPAGVRFAPVLPTDEPNPNADPDYFDRQYVQPKIVAMRQVPDAR